MNARTSKCDALGLPERPPPGVIRRWAGHFGQWLLAETRAVSLAYLNAKASKGNPRCEYRLGLVYESGQQGFHSDREAFRWFLRAAFKGLADAQAKVAQYRQAGRGVPKDDTEAFIWFRKAADQGHVEAQAQLAQFYREGRGVIRDLNEATKWYRKAAAQGWTENERRAA